jgi:hypothetical protein
MSLSHHTDSDERSVGNLLVDYVFPFLITTSLNTSPAECGMHLTKAGRLKQPIISISHRALAARSSRLLFDPLQTVSCINHRQNSALAYKSLDWLILRFRYFCTSCRLL